MTPQEFSAKVKAKYPQYQNMDDMELTQRVVAKYPQYAASVQMPTTTIPEENSSVPKELAVGVGKSGVGLFKGIGELGRKIQKSLPSPLQGFGAGAGESGDSMFDEGSAANTDLTAMATPNTTAEKVGKFAGDVAQFAVPSTIAGRATKTASLLKQSLAQGAASGATTMAQTGDLDKETAMSVLFGAAIPPVGKALSVAGNNLTQELPEWLVRPLLKQAKDAKIAGQDIAPYLLKTGRVGSVDTIVSKTQTVIDQLDDQVKVALREATEQGVTVDKNALIKSVVDKINASGGAIDDVEVASIIERLAPQAKGLLNKPTLTVEEANQLRSSIDRTLGDRGFLREQLPFNKEVLRDFTNEVRENVKTLVPSTRSTFDDFAKNIRLRDALLERASSGGGVNSIGLFDILTGMGGFAASGGNPLGALALPAARRVFEAASFKTGAAKALTSMNALAPILEKLAPAERAIFLETMQSLLEDDQAKPTGE